MPRYEFTEGSSSKFWEITLEGDSFTTAYGRIGTPGQSTTKSFADDAAAKKEYDKIVAEKVKKGYQLVGGGGDEDDGSEESSAPAAAPGKHNPELESAILANPESPDAYLVYADWLQANGDPRGELIVVQNGLRTKPSDSGLKKQEAKLLKEHQAQLLGFVGDNEERFRLTWSLGFLQSAWVGLNYDSAEEGLKLDDLVRKLLAHPSGRFLRELRLGLDSFEGENSYDHIIKALVKLKPESLRSLFIGEFEYPDETEMSWSAIGDASKLWPTFPVLEKVILQSGGELKLGTIVLPECREFQVRTGGLGKGPIKSICAAHWPKLETLEVWFGNHGYGAEGDIKQIQPILEAKGLPNLKHLRLKNAEFTDDIAAALGKSKILKQLKSVDLTMGTLTNKGVEAIAEQKAAFSHLTLLDLSDNAVADVPAATRLLKGICEEVSLDNQSPDRIQEDYRYTAVGE